MDELSAGDEKKEEFLENRAEITNKNHDKVIKPLADVLQHAQFAGIALNRAKKLVKAQKEHWKSWVEKNFRASYETAAAYM